LFEGRNPDNSEGFLFMLEVKEKQCDQCLLSPNRIVSAQRMKQLIKSCNRSDSHFQCHKGTIEGKDIVCRGFYDNFSTNLIRAMGRLNAIKFV